jgi:hypothetical protein
MTPEIIEDLFIRSFDEPLNNQEKEELVKGLHTYSGLATDLSTYRRIREAIRRNNAASFRSNFAQRVMNRIENLRVEIDLQIGFFFKKYQLAALGVLIALFAFSAVFSDQLSLKSILGIEENTTDEIIQFDLYKTFNEDL